MIVLVGLKQLLGGSHCSTWPGCVADSWIAAGALAAIGGGAFILSKVDPEFNDFMGNTSVKVPLLRLAVQVTNVGTQCYC